MRFTNKEIKDLISELPENIREVVIRFNWAEEILAIAKRHNLQIDEVDLFREETLLVILGISSAENYEKKLVQHIGLSDETARILVDEANQNIFSELQRQAFGSKNIETKKETLFVSNDPYREPIDIKDINTVFKEEGIELLAHDTEQNIFPIDIQKDIDELSQSPKDKEQDIEKKRTETLISYNEDIEDSDYSGIKSHKIDTNILKESSHNIHVQKNLGDKNLSPQTLDKHILENSFITKGDTIDASPTLQEEIKEEGFFPKHSKEK